MDKTSRKIDLSAKGGEGISLGPPRPPAQYLRHNPFSFTAWEFPRGQC